MERRGLWLLLPAFLLLGSCSVFRKTRTTAYHPHADSIRHYYSERGDTLAGIGSVSAFEDGKVNGVFDRFSGRGTQEAVPQLEESEVEIDSGENAVLSAELSRSVAAISFRPSETEHVRVTHYDPFGGGNSLSIPLDALQERFCFPYPGKLISNYGYRGRSMHTGVDIKAVPRDTIRCAFDGVVRMSKPYSGYGNLVVVRHANGLETLYAHNARNLVRVNETVRAGQPLALAGRTGRATTEHLHFEVRVEGQHFNPGLLLDIPNHCLRKGTLYVYNRGGKIVASNRPLDSREPQTVQAPSVSLVATAHAVDGEGAAGSGSPRYYRIRSGDTLSHIAKRYGTTVSALCRLNGITPAKLLQINQRLRVK